MVEFMEVVSKTFFHLRARATQAHWGWSRKPKSESPIKPKREQTKEESASTVTPQLPLQLHETYWHVGLPDTQEGSARPDTSLQGFPLGSELAGENAKPRSESSGPLEEHYNGFTGPTTSPGNDFHIPRSPKDPELRVMNEKLIEQQQDVSAKRLQVRQSRTALRHKRDEVSELTAVWMEQLQSFFATLDTVDAELLRGYKQLQAATEEHMKMESSYHQEEDQLEEQEYMLTLSMESFAALSGDGPVPNIPNHPRLWDQRAETSKGPELPRCIINYLRRIADERMLQESLSDLESEWVITLERRDQRYHLQIPLDEESEEFLRTFDEQRIKIWNDLNNAQLDVNSLRTVCLDHGYTNFDYEDISSLNLFQYVGNNAWKPERDPLKLSPEEEFSYSPETVDQTYGSPTDLDWKTPEITPSMGFHFSRGPGHDWSLGSPEFINKWMLHQLRISSMGIWHLQRHRVWEALRQQGWKDHDISRHVLDGWFSDEAALAPLSSGSHLAVDDPAGFGADERRERVKSPSLPSFPQPSAQKIQARRRSVP